MRPTILAVIGLAMMTMTGSARDYGRKPARYERWSPVNRSIHDLQAIYSRARVDRHESDHFRRAIDDLAEFQRKAARGDFDTRRLDRAIWNMSHLADARQLHPRDRAILRDNMYELQNLRASAYRGRR